MEESNIHIVSEKRLAALSDELLEIGMCAKSWAGEVRLLGNVEAKTILAACADSLALIEEVKLLRKKH